MKLKLQLNHSELVALNAHLYITLGSESIEKLRENWQVYVVCCCLKELYDKTLAKVEQERLFPSKRDKMFRLSLTQAQALALACTLVDDEPVDDQNNRLPMDEYMTFEKAFQQLLLGKIHQAYLV